MGKKKEVHFRCEQRLWDEFTKLFPFKGEPTAFFNRCMQTAIMLQRSSIPQQKLNEIVKEAKEVENAG